MNDRSADADGDSDVDRRRFTRRAMLGGIVGGAVAGAAVVGVAPRLPWHWLFPPDPTDGIPDAQVGVVELSRLRSSARGADVGVYTAVPAQHGNGAGLPVCIVLHGASATVADFERFGFAQFLTAAVERGTPPFALIGADGGRLFWEARGDDDPMRMVLDEVPVWAADRGFDIDRTAVWGWSMGGYGALRAAVLAPERFRAVAAFSPAIRAGSAVTRDVDRLAGLPVGVWCGTDDSLFGSVEAFVDSLPVPPAIRSFSPGGHTRPYWNAQTLGAFAFIGNLLSST